MNLSNKQYDLGFLSSEFEGIRFELFASGDDLFMSCIACWCNRASDLVSNWSSIQSLVSAYYHPPGRLAKWNIYLVIFCTELVPLHEKYVIQNDKYAARKIVLDGIERLPTLEEAEVIINNELLGADLSIQDVKTEAQQAIDMRLIDLISGIPLDMAVKSRSARSEVINNVIEFFYKNENKEG